MEQEEIRQLWAEGEDWILNTFIARMGNMGNGSQASLLACLIWMSQPSSIRNDPPLSLIGKNASTKQPHYPKRS